MAELPLEAEHLLVSLANATVALNNVRDDLARREMEISEFVVEEFRGRAQIPGELDRAAERLHNLRKTTYRSELASLAGKVVAEERRRARILRKLDAYPALGESVPAVDIAVEHDGERGFIIRTGGGRVFRFSLPAIIDRGVWRADGKYERGDAVTSDGSLWIAREDNPNHEPGKGAQWRLAVTRGRNGRDANRTTRNPT